MIHVSIKNKAFPSSGTIISDLSFSISSGELVTIVGPSGAGKSTLLNIVSGLDNVFSGQIKAQTEFGKQARISLMFQEPRLMPWLTVTENVTLVSDNTVDNQIRAQALLELVGLSDYVDSYPDRLSGGMKKRVSLARAFMPQPDILLMDEPFASLDVPSAEDLREKLLILWKERKTTILYVTHSLKEAISISDRILFLSKNPMNIVLQKTVDLERPRTINCDKVVAFHRDLMRQHPELLTGFVDKK